MPLRWRRASRSRVKSQLHVQNRSLIDAPSFSDRVVTGAQGSIAFLHPEGSPYEL